MNTSFFHLLQELLVFVALSSFFLVSFTDAFAASGGSIVCQSVKYGQGARRKFMEVCAVLTGYTPVPGIPDSNGNAEYEGSWITEYDIYKGYEHGTQIWDMNTPPNRTHSVIVTLHDNTYPETPPATAAGQECTVSVDGVECSSCSYCGGNFEFTADCRNVRKGRKIQKCTPVATAFMIDSDPGDGGERGSMPIFYPLKLSPKRRGRCFQQVVKNECSCDDNDSAAALGECVTRVATTMCAAPIKPRAARARYLQPLKRKFKRYCNATAG